MGTTLRAALLFLTAVVLPAADRHPHDGGWSETPAGACPVPIADPGLRCYVARVELDPGTAPAGLSLYLSSVHEAERLFVNGLPAGATPSAFANGHLRNPGPYLDGYRRVYPLNPAQVRTGRNELVMHVSCHGWPCGPTGTWAVARDRDAFAWQWEDTIVNLALAAALMLGAMIFLTLGWKIESEPQHLRFAAFVAAGAVSIILHDPIWARESWRVVIYRGNTAADALLLPLFMNVLLAAVSAVAAPTFRRAVRLLIALSVLPLVFPMGWIAATLIAHKLAGSALLLALLWRVYRADPGLPEQDNRRELVAASVILTLGAAGDLLIAHELWHPPSPWLDNTMPIALVAAVYLAARALARRYRTLQATAYRDPLTGLNSRRLMNEQIPGELARADRLGLPVTVLFCDIDHFKRINDRWGHAAGDRVLREVAQRLDHARREGDLLCRWGGEEFALFLIGQDRGEGGAAAERLRAAVAHGPMHLGPGLPEEPVTISVGVASLPARQGMSSLLAAADEALYEAKRAGRNRVSTYPAALM